MKITTVVCGTALAGALTFAAAPAAAATQGETATEAPFAVEYYYKVKWGYYGEFLALFKKNHWPVLKAGLEEGRFLEVTADSPIHHAGEGSRWDLRVTIVYKNAAVAHDDSDPGPLLAKLFPDQETFRKEEQRRFELLVEHMDVPVRAHDVSTW